MPERQRDSGLILLVTRNFPPLVGGMENVNDRLLRELARCYRVALCGPAGSRDLAPAAAAVSESRINPLSTFLLATFGRAAAMAHRLKPRLVIAGSGLTLPIAWFAARLVGAKLAVYLHGLDIIAPNRVYQMVWPRFFSRCDLVMVNSRSTADLAASAGVARDRIRILHPGTSIPDLDPDARMRFRQSLGLASEPVLLSVGRLTRRKGLAEFVSRALPRILTQDPSVRLVIVGGEATEALTSSGGSERSRILAAASEAGVEHAVQFIGRLDDASLGDAYQAADLHVFPVLRMEGDVEGFGMVALESAAHGLRTVAFDVGGIPDAVAVPTTGALVPVGDYDAFADTVSACLRSPPLTVEACRDFARAKSWDVFGERARDLVAAELQHG